jgi:methionyl-tRNA formyltransferase
MAPEARLVFLGSGAFGVPALERLAGSGFRPLLVITQPDRPAGRGRRSAPPPLKVAASTLGLRVDQPERIAAPAALEAVRALSPDFLVVVAYGQILPAEALSLPRLAPVNLHASLLPRWRGAAPVARAILAGDLVSGVTTMRMDAGVDTGDILLQEEVAIGSGDSAADLEARLARAGAPLLERTLRSLADGTLRGRAQPRTGATRARRLSVEEARLDWGLTAVELERRVRGYNPWPVAWTLAGGKRLQIWRASLQAGAGGGMGDGEGAAPPGTVSVGGGGDVRVACGEGALRLEEVQFAGARRLPAREAVHGRKISDGQRLGS